MALFGSSTSCLFFFLLVVFSSLCMCRSFAFACQSQYFIRPYFYFRMCEDRRKSKQRPHCEKIKRFFIDASAKGTAHIQNWIRRACKYEAFIELGSDPIQKVKYFSGFISRTILFSLFSQCSSNSHTCTSLHIAEIVCACGRSFVMHI